MSGLKLHAQTSFYANAVEFWLAEESGDKLALGTSVTMEDVERGLMAPPTFRIPLDNVQELFEQLWKQGFRSAHDKGNAETLDAARQEHIGDLRKAAKLA